MPPPHDMQVQADELVRRIDELEGHLRRTQAELEAADRLSTLGLLTGAIAHECNNLLTPVLAYARAALDAPADADLQRKALVRAAEGAERVSRIASSVLRLAGGPACEEPATCDPAEAIQRAIECLGRPPDRCGIELRTEIPPGLRLAIPPTDLEHVLLNLLLNALRAMRSGGVITINAQRNGSTWNTSPGLATLEITDTGPGIAPEILDSLFQPARRMAGMRPNEGSGLGLIICRRLLEASGGTIDVQSTPGAGACFRITLPVATSQAKAA
ncbi:MAG: HAMP domain-containing histidine kinase [Phycisphaerales bacterium]|nr:HAMP domain-containing histidine kinase [Phycisphaerales bacterium]